MSEIKTLPFRFKSTSEQIQCLEKPEFKLAKFEDKLKSSSLYPLKPTGIDILQINVGKMCNQTCHHCHVDAGPTRKEKISKEHMQKCVELVKTHHIKTVDLTGGAPEMHPLFRDFVVELKKAGAHIINRCNLTILLANKSYADLPEFFKEHEMEIVSSLPHYSKRHTDRQRGDGVFDKSILGLKLLNKVGYGLKDSPLKLNLVYNPSGNFLPGSQQDLEKEFKRQLFKDFQIEFNSLYCITNMPISRYLEYLLTTKNYESYMTTLVNAYNPIAAKGVMCRNTISVSWDGYLYDCDFNQMLDLKVDPKNSQSLESFKIDELLNRDIVLGQHCYGCTAGSGSSCGGATS